MKILRDASLKPFNTFGVDARCSAIVRLSDRLQLPAIMDLPEYRPGEVLMLGGGSNVLFTADYPGLVVMNELVGKQVLDATEKHAYLRFYAGENWHECVLWSLENKYAGIENVSLIPGSAGAAPIQNIGAYGVELDSVLDCVEVWDLQQGNLHMLRNADCQFSYRDSLFKQHPGRYWVTSITLKLSRGNRVRVSYQGLKEELQSMGVDNPRPCDVSKAVIRIRTRKLPDPAVSGNAGSFFKNPVIDPGVASRLADEHSQLPVFQQKDGRCKVSAAWLIEKCGWKGFREGDAGVSEQHALVMVNHGEASGAELLSLANRVREAVHEQFGLRLEIEPHVVGPG